jgi:hypothetical protein
MKLSKSYINHSGTLITYTTASDRIGQRIGRIFNALPIAVSFILCSLLVIQVFCVIGLIRTFIDPVEHASEFGIYIFLFIAINIICTLGFGIGWLLTEQVENHSTQHDHPTGSKMPNNESDLWQN